MHLLRPAGLNREGGGLTPSLNTLTSIPDFIRFCYSKSKLDLVSGPCQRLLNILRAWVGWFSVDIIRFEFYIHMIMTRTMITMTMTLTTMTKIPRVCIFFFHLPAQVGHNSYPNIMAFLAGEPDAWQADEECKQEVSFEKSPCTI